MKSVRFPLRTFLACAGVLALLAGCETTKTSQRPTVTRSYSEATLILGPSGEVVRVESARAKVREQEKAAYWRGDGVSGAPSIAISIAEQKAYFYKGGQLVGETPVSTGSASHPTPRGNFKVTIRDKDHRSNVYGDYVDERGYSVVSNIDARVDRRPPGTKFLGAPMPYFLHFHDGAGLHSGYLPGFPDSHGCVRLPDHMAKVFFENAPLGTPVRVY